MARMPSRQALLCLALCLLASAPGAFAKGNKETPTEKASGLENWEHSFDISGSPSGKYNIVIEGKDAAGNLAIAGPFNVYVDPASDLPRVSLVNPRPSQRVGGDLVVVGTASDDDGVERVEVSLDGGEWRKAEGGDFWTLAIDTKELADGRRSLAARAIDLNGLAGPEAKVLFDLDRAKPAAALASPLPGQLVSGQIRLAGTLFDANGLSRLELSTDAASTFLPVELKRERDQTRAAFSYALDTRKFPDGPLVVWMRSVDGVGSQGSAAFLLVVDNTKPAIEIARPGPGQSVNGRFALAGAARDAVGIKRLSYLFGAESGEIPLVPGDPFFVKEFDALPLKADKAEILLVAEDSIGNLTRIVIAPKIDREADKPRIELAFPAPGGRASPGELVWGSILDDDGVSALRYSFDGGAPTEIPAAEVFSFPLPDLPSGPRKLALVAVDSLGTPGDPLLLSFTMDRGSPSISFEALAPLQAPSGADPAATRREYRPGLEVRVDGGEALEGLLKSPNPPLGAEYSVSGSAPRKLELQKGAEAETWLFRLPLDRSLPYGFATLSVEAKDGLGNLGRAEALLYVRDYASIREDPGFVFSDARIGEGGLLSLSAAEPLRGAFYREELASLRLEPPTRLVEASFSGSLVTLAVREEGLSAPTRLLGTTTKGREYAAGPFTFRTDATPPSLSLSLPAEGGFVPGELRVEGRVEDSGGLASLGWRLGPAGELRSLAPGRDGAFSLSIPAADLAPGPSLLFLEAADVAGNLARATRGFFADREPPVATFLSPPPLAEVSGAEDVAVLVKDDSGLASVEYAEDGLAFAPIEFREGFFVHRADFAAHPAAAYRLRDRAGNERLLKPDLRALPRAIGPAAASSVEIPPAEGELKVELAGAAGARKLSLLLPALPEAEFTALGDFGTLAVPERFATRLLLSGAAVLKGQVSAPNALKAVSLSADGGQTYLPLASFKDEKSAKPILPFALSLDSMGLANGETRFLLKAEDFAGASYFAPLFALVDNSPPSAELLYPEGGSASAPGALPLVLRLRDNRALASAELQLGAEKQALPVGEGGSYFVRVLDAAAVKGGQLVGTVSVRDESGSAAAAAFKVAYEALADLPALALELPASPLEAGALVQARGADDDGPPSLELSVDGAAPLVSESGGLGLILPPLAPGKHVLVALARDSGGRKTEQRGEFQLRGPAPLFSAPTIGAAGSARPWEPGIGVALAPALLFAGSVEAPNGLFSLEYSVGDGPALKALLGKPATTGGAIPFSAALPAKLPYERVTVELRARDLLGLETLRRYDFHALLPAVPGAPPADTAEGIRLSESRIAGAETSTRILLAPGQEILGRFNGRPLASIEVSPSSPLLSASFEGPGLMLKAEREGLASALRLQATTIDGDRFEWGPFELATDAEPPALRLDSPSAELWVPGRMRLSGEASDPNGIAELSYSLDGQTWVPLPPKPSPPPPPPPAPTAAPNAVPPAPTAAKPVASPPAAAGKAPAAAGKAAPAPAPASPAAPALAPPPPAPAEIPAAKPTTRAFDLEVALSSAPEGGLRLGLRARDGAGRERGLDRFVLNDSIPPELVQVIPAPGEAVNGTTTFVGEVRDGGRLASASFQPALPAPVEEVSGIATFSRTLDLARLALPLPAGGGFRAADKAGNSAILAPELRVDLEADKPRVDIQAPAELEVLRADFIISGAAFDDDGIAEIQLRLDGGEWRRLEASGTSFTVPVALADTTDNEHLVEAYAVDLYGVKGETASRRYRISKEEPIARMTSPSIARPHRGLVTMSGSAADANGVASGRISYDNSTSFNALVGAEAWSYPLDTKVLADGLHPVAVRPLDEYGTEGFYASLITVDNTPPEAALDLPADGASFGGELLVSGRVSDNLALAAARVEILPAGSKGGPVLAEELGTGTVVRKVLDLSALSPGAYSVRLVARDRADNESLASRDILLLGAKPADSLELLYPVPGAELSGRLVVGGRAFVAGGAGSVELLAGGQRVASAEPDKLGNFSLELPAEALPEGELSLAARTLAPDGSLVASRDISIRWRKYGPWVSVDSPSLGSYLGYRPFIEGRAGWAAEPSGAPPDKAAAQAAKRAAEGRKVTGVELSLDNGRSFQPAEGGASWRFRLETPELPEGPLYILARAHYADGSSSKATAIYHLDKTAPEIGILEPRENGRFNGRIEVLGFASDENGLGSVGAALRKGDKRSYELPAFIQGLYLDGHVFGATTYDAGLGLSFFQDNVKLQVQYGSSPASDLAGKENRFYGDVAGVKLLANIAYLPASYLLGPDWDFLSGSFALGANFSYFSSSSGEGGGGIVVGAAVAQVEFPKFTFKELSAFRKYSLYMEAQAWFLSADVEGGILLRLSLGTRIGIF